MDLREPTPGMLVILKGNQSNDLVAKINGLANREGTIAHLRADIGGGRVIPVNHAERDETATPKPGTWRFPPLPKIDATPVPMTPEVKKEPKNVVDVAKAIAAKK